MPVALHRDRDRQALFTGRGQQVQAEVDRDVVAEAGELQAPLLGEELFARGHRVTTRFSRAEVKAASMTSSAYTLPAGSTGMRPACSSA
ncbi:hypothetical protein GCM10022267_28540 [Lentzea roselyniae]|uniref:Uncharacterized protein n=1 Tax=Lentzea roselyniae TaxID=531940 RepID=A0ABP7AUX8_9PSEU